MKALNFCKKLIYKLCGKARWLLLTALILLVISLASYLMYPLYRYTSATTDDYDHIIHEYPLQKVETLSINNDGDMAIFCLQNPNGVSGFINIDTGAQDYCGIGIITGSDINDGKEVAIYNFALTDSGELYAVYEAYEEDTVVLVSEDYVIQDSVFTLEHDTSDRSNGWRLSALHYFDGCVTFAKTDMNGVTLYSIDTVTQAVSTSRLYETDPNGTYTFNVIPVDGSFLFIRSDGNVYDVRFDEPMENSIYCFDPADSSHPLFDAAVISPEHEYTSDG